MVEKPIIEIEYENKLDSKRASEIDQSDSDLLLESAILANLKKSYEERIEAHENARQLANDLFLAGRELRAKP